jgi:hypothetical protein
MSDHLLNGTVTPPADMMDAARQSLSPELFEILVQATGGRAPTPTELCAFADYQREVSEIIRATILDSLRKLFAPLTNGASIDDLIADAERSLNRAAGGPLTPGKTNLMGDTTHEYLVPKPN